VTLVVSAVAAEVELEAVVSRAVTRDVKAVTVADVEKPAVVVSRFVKRVATVSESALN
jgi:hypothetical protein